MTHKSNRNHKILKRLTLHVAAAFAFVVVLFSVSFAVNGDCALHTLLSGKRAPAMIPRSLDRSLEIQHGLSPNETSRQSTDCDFGLTKLARDFSKGLNLAVIEPVHARAADYSAIIPSSLAPANSSGEVAAQILDYSVSNFFKQEAMRGSFIGKAAHTVEERMKADVSFGGETPTSTQHNLKFQMKASQSKASMQYSGLTNAEVSYSVASRSTDVELYETISSNSSFDSKLVFNHSVLPNESRDVLSLRMNW